MLRTFALMTSLITAGAAQAAVIDWTATLSPNNEVPPVVGSTASGSAFGTLDTTNNLLSWTITFSGFASQVVAMHFHEAPAGVNGAVVFNIGTNFGLGSPNIGSTGVTDAQEAVILADGWYINVHSVDVPSGEIRGQVEVSAVPLPGAMGLSLAGLGGFLAFRRRRK